MKILDFLNIELEDIDGMIIVIGLLLFLILGCFFGIAFTINNQQTEECDIGNPSIGGDYHTGNSFFSQRECAVEDCVAFNKIQEQLGSEQRCVV